MNHVEAEERRDAEPVTFDGQPLQAVDLRRIGDKQQRSHAALPQSRFHLERLLVPIHVQSRLDAVLFR